MEDPFIKALYATFVTYLPKEEFSYDLISHQDDRGIFVEFLKSKLFGQVSFLTSNPGVTRGEHFHNTKLEKFLVIKGEASSSLDLLIIMRNSRFIQIIKNFKLLKVFPGGLTI